MVQRDISNSNLKKDDSKDQQILDVFLVINEEGMITFLSRHGEKFLLKDRDQILGKNISDFLLRGKRDVYLQYFREAFVTDSLVAFEEQCPFSLRKWVDVRIYPSPDYLSVFIRDVSKIRNVEEEINNKYQKLEILTETIDDLLYSQEPKQLLDKLFETLSSQLDFDVYFNYIFDEEQHKLQLINYMGISEETANRIKWLEIGEAVCGCVAKERSKIVVENIEKSNDPRVQLIRGLGIKSYACHPLIAYEEFIGTLSFGSKTRSFFSQDELQVISTICKQISIIFDRIFMISKLKTANSELQKKNHLLYLAKEAAEKANKGKTDFLSKMSHELRTPLNSILGYTQLLLFKNDKQPLSEEQNSMINKIYISGKHLLHLINEILSIVKNESSISNLKNEQVNIYNLIEESVRAIRPYSDLKNINIYNKVASNTITILGDKEKIKQVLNNLLSNAVKYNKEFGDITVKCERKENYIVILVEDTGIGIDEQEQNNIFEPFYQINSYPYNQEGTGIGLTLVQQLIHEMGGRVGFLSKIGVGSSFWVQIPINNSKN